MYGWLTSICVFLALATFSEASNPPSPETIALLQKESARFPLMVPGKDLLGDSVIMDIEPPEKALHPDMFYYHGFRFRTPDWMDGRVSWMCVRVEGIPFERGQFSWFVIPAEGQPKQANLVFSDWEIKRVKRLAERYPKATHCIDQSLPEGFLEPGKEYIVWYRFHQPRVLKLAVALTVNSHRGYETYGALPISDWPLHIPVAQKVTAGIFKMRKSAGNEAILQMLEPEIEARAAYPSVFISLFRAIWTEAQTGGGRDSPEWAADLNEWSFQQCLKYGYLKQATDLFSNLVVTLTNVRRYGRKAELVAWLREGLAQDQSSIEPSSYPDLGAAFPDFPEVRRRDIPKMVPWSNQKVASGALKTIPNGFDRMTASGYQKMAGQLGESGHWHASLEWLVWLADWASAACAGKMDIENANIWYVSAERIASTMASLDLLESATEREREILACKLPDAYLDRTKILAEVQLMGYEMDLGHFESRFVDRTAELADKLVKNRYSSKANDVEARRVHAKSLICAGRRDEALELLEELVAQGSENARLTRIRCLLDAHNLEGLEEMILESLRFHRENSLKIGEAEIYGLYADLLEAQGRLLEALQIRKEAVGLCKTFQLFARLPKQCAGVAKLLALLGNDAGSKAAADEAKRSMNDRVPLRIQSIVRNMLANLPEPAATTKKDPKGVIDLQPQSVVVVPVEGCPSLTCLSLANPSTFAESGVLKVTGIPVSIKRDDDGGEIDITADTEGEENAEQKLNLEPGSYWLLHVKFPAGFETGKTLALSWDPAATEGGSRHSKILFEAADEGATAAIIEAGEFRLNPFYGVPIRHHFVDATNKSQSPPLRLVASQEARIELYGDDDVLCCVDAEGNGSLDDPGDELHIARHEPAVGISLPLTDGQTAFRIQLYPKDEIAAEGMTLLTEAFIGDKWVVYAEDRIVR